MIGMRVCLLVASVLGNLTGTLPKDSMKVFIERLEQAAKSVQDLYYIQQINGTELFIIKYYYHSISSSSQGCRPRKNLPKYCSRG